MNLSVKALSASVAILASTPVLADMPTQEQMWRMIQQQQQEIQALKAQLNKTSDQVAEADAKAEAAVEAVEDQSTGSSSKASWAERTKLGGYAELHYNNLSGEGGASDKEELDLHRLVLFLGHEFNDDIRFFSEIEIEHAIAGDGQVGEVEVEQAYVEIDINDYHAAKAGVYLLPVGLLNETHEPPTFYGVERNPVEKNIIPSTWWAAGAEIKGEIADGFSYNAGIHEGLKTSAGSNYAPRKGRQKSGKAAADELAGTARLKWTGMPGLEIAGTLHYQSDITQSSDPTAGAATLLEGHVAYNTGPFGLRALYAQWDLDGSGPRSVGADEQYGWFIEPSFKITETVGVFGRYNQYDNQAGNSTDSEKEQWDIGMNWWPHPDVVFKADYQFQDNDNGKNQDGFNLGVGLQF